MLLKPHERINWTELILDLRRAPHRLRFRDMAERTGYSEQAIKACFYRGHQPLYEMGCALVALHESCYGDQSRRKNVFQSPHTSEKELSVTKIPRKRAEPGAQPIESDPEDEQGRSDPDAAIMAAQGGRARRIAKPRPSVPASKVKGDPDRPRTAAVNARREMSYAEAMRLREAGNLPRAVLTERGWVAANERPVPAGARV